MIFDRKKNAPASTREAHRPRGRDTRKDNPLARRFLDDDEPETIDLEKPPSFEEAADRPRPDTATRDLSRERRAADERPGRDPLAGFLVIIGGPGHGLSSELFYGVNSVGRHTRNRVSLDHGDERISRDAHCLITYDPASRKFFLQPGEGPNLTCLDGDPVSAPTELSAGAHIGLGDTLLRFVPLCGDDFDWDT